MAKFETWKNDFRNTAHPAANRNMEVYLWTPEVGDSVVTFEEPGSDGPFASLGAAAISKVRNANADKHGREGSL